MGIRFFCSNGHKLHVKAFQAGQQGICPHCGVAVQIPLESTRPSSRHARPHQETSDAARRSGDTVTLVENAPSVPATPAPSPVEEAPSKTGRAAEVAQPVPEMAPQPTPQPVAQSIPQPIPPNPASQPAVIGPGIATPEATDDPLAGPKEVVWYVRHPAGGQYGPAAPELIRTWLAQGRVSPDSLVWREGWRDWREAGEIFPRLTEPEKADPEETVPESATTAADSANPGLESDAIPELESIVAAVMPLPGSQSAGQAITGRPVKKTSGSPLLVIGVLLGLGLAVLLAVFLWVQFT